jgi:hypothetical protein
MKSFTDIEQSKKLAEILPIESADMWWNFYSVTLDNTTPLIIHLDEPWIGNFNWNNEPDNIPAWSLAALLELIQDDIKIEKTLFDQSDLFTYSILSDTFDYRTYEHEELIDACVEMIVKLKEKGLI